MSADDPSDDTGDEIEVETGTSDAGDRRVRDRLEAEADRAIEGFDEGIVDMLSWVLDTETRARIYVHLRQHPHSTSDEIAAGTGLYPSTVREALAELHDEGTVHRRKRENEGAGNNPYEYTAIPPSELVGTVIEQVQDQLNTVFNLDHHLGRSGSGSGTTEPVTITVEEAADGRDGPEDPDEDDDSS